MTLGQLKTLLTVANAGSVAGAARELVVSPGAISSTIAQLEREIGVALTEREGRGIRLTVAGTVLAEYARSVLSTIEEAVVRTREAGLPSSPILRIGAVATVGEELLPRWLQGFIHQYPSAKVNLEVANKATLFELLANRRVDLVVSGRPESKERLSVLATRRHSLLLVAEVSSAKMWFGPSLRPTPEQISSITWLLRETGSGTRSTAEELLAVLGLSPPNLTLGSNLAIKRAVLLGLGVAVLSADSVGREIATGQIVSLEFEPFPQARSWCLVARKDELPSRSVKSFLDYLGALGEVEFTPALSAMGEQLRNPQGLR
jgi:DNA-binding transcriptional LysR family regulator